MTPLAPTSNPSSSPSSENRNFVVTTDALDSKGHFDPRYTCDLDNSSPEIRWDGAPAETASFALIIEDPDAPHGLFTHWLIYHIPGNLHHLPAGVPPQETLPNGIKQGVNSFGKLGYGGPCPPIGHGEHRYFIRLHALKSIPEIPSRLSREELLSSIGPHVIATAEVIGKYRRERMIQKAG